MTRTRRLDVLVLVVLVGALLAAALHYWQGYYLEKPYPFNTPLYQPGDKFEPAAPGLGGHFFGDWYEVWRQVRAPSAYVTPGLAPSNYFPFTHFLFKPLAWMGYPASTAIFLLGSWVLIALAIWLALGSEDRIRKGIACVALAGLSYPVLFALDRGNVELTIFLLLWLSLALIERTRYMAAAVPLAIAASMKLVPLLLAAVFVAERKWRALLLTIGLTVGLSVIALLAMHGGFSQNVHGLRQGLHDFSNIEQSESGHHSLQHGTSIRGLLAVLVGEGWSWLKGPLDAQRYISYGIGAVFVTGALLLPLLLWERVALLVITLIVVPPVSFDYRLIHLLLPILLLLRQARPVPRLPVLLLALMLVPKSLPVLYADINIGTVLNPLLLLALGVTILVSANRRRRGRNNLAAAPSF